jgi:hypothetical protein
MRIDMMPAAALALLLAILVTAGARGRLNGQPEGSPAMPDAQAAIQTVLNDFHDAASKADFERYFSHWSDESVFLGTDATERWVGQEFREFARPHFSKGTGWTYRPRDRHISVDGAAPFAWFDELLDNDSYGECRGSGIVAMRGGRWMILQYNLSIPIPNDMAAAETARIAEWKRQNAPTPPK